MMATSWSRVNPQRTPPRIDGLLLVAIWLFGCLGPAQAQEPFKPGDEPTRLINKLLAFQWKANRLEPSARTTDHEFLRRASLDIIGRIPTVEEVLAFEKDQGIDKRAQLIDRLLASDEYARYWATLWTHWLMDLAHPPTYRVLEHSLSKDGKTTWLINRADDRVHREQLKQWLEEDVFSPKNGISYKEMVHRLLTASGRTNEHGAVNFILAHVGEPINDEKHGEDGQFDMVPITVKTLRLFLGYRWDVLAYDDLPNRELAQSQFWGVNAFFRQVERVGQPQPAIGNIGARPLTLQDNAQFNKNGIVYYAKPNGVTLPIRAQFLDGKRIPRDSKLSRREHLAMFLTSHEQFPKANVNRMWGYLFGHGLNSSAAADDFGKHNPLVHPELLAQLANDFARQGAYEPRNLIRWICNSDAYQLKCYGNATNEKVSADRYFSRMLLKPMNLDQLFESLMTATGNGSKETRIRRSATWYRCIKNIYGNEPDNEGRLRSKLHWILMMINGAELNEAVHNPKSRIAEAMRNKDPRAIIDELFLTVLNRHASEAEYRKLTDKMKMRVREQDPSDPWRDLFWALLNSNEFILNH